MKHAHKLSAFGFLICVALHGCMQEQHVYSADPVYAQVVDSDTGKPIEDVVVVAYWELYQGSITGDGMPCGAANVEETLTDKDGWFHIPGWGPVKGACGVMRNMNPFVYLFKSGYAYVRKAGGVGLNVSKRVTKAQVDWNGQTIKLSKINNINYHDIGPHTYYAQFSSLDINLGLFVTYMPIQCNWKKMPYMLRALELERRKFSEAAGYPVGGITAELMLHDKWFHEIAPQCGSPKAFIEELIK
jgi:hypothetical protein